MTARRRWRRSLGERVGWVGAVGGEVSWGWGRLMEGWVGSGGDEEWGASCGGGWSGGVTARHRRQWLSGG